MCYWSYNPPHFLRNGVAITLYTAIWASRNWERTTKCPEPPYQEHIFIGGQSVPIFGWVAIPENPCGTIVGTYGITGELDNQWFLKLLGRKAYAQGFAVVLFDWRGHGRTAQLSPTLTSDGLYEGEDFIHIAAAAKAMGCPGKFWFTGYSLGGQLALWAVSLRWGDWEVGRWGDTITPSLEVLGLEEEDIGGAAVICPSLDSKRSLAYLVKQPFGRYMEKAITRNLKKLAWRIYAAHPNSIDPEAIARVNIAVLSWVKYSNTNLKKECDRW